MLDRYLFTANDLRLSPSLLNKLGYSEWAGYGYVGFTGYGNLPEWAYDPPKRHDVPLAEQIANAQRRIIAEMFTPMVLSRIADGASETRDSRPMMLADLFSWMDASVYREIAGSARPIDGLRRTLQKTYLEQLIDLYLKPDAAAPGDAKSLARASLVRVQSEAERASRAGALDPTTRAHVQWLAARARAALNATESLSGS
jgi:hypothetical protein